MCSRVTKWRWVIFSHGISSCGGFFVMTYQPARCQTTHSSMTQDNSDVTGTVHRDQRANFGEHTRLVTRCKYFLIWFILHKNLRRWNLNVNGKWIFVNSVHIIRIRNTNVHSVISILQESFRYSSLKDITRIGFEVSFHFGSHNWVDVTRTTVLYSKTRAILSHTTTPVVDSVMCWGVKWSIL